MNKEERKRYAQLEKETTIIYSKMAVIEARHKKDIWMDPTYDKDRKDVLRQAELTLRLSEDTEYATLRDRSWELDTERRELGDPYDLL